MMNEYTFQCKQKQNKYGQYKDLKLNLSSTMAGFASISII